MKISDKLYTAITKDMSTSNIFDLHEYKNAQKNIRDMKDSFDSINTSDEYHVIHKSYLTTLNTVTFLAEEFSALPLFDEYADLLEDAMDEFMPGSHLSPISNSYFTCWASFDLIFGKQKETIGSCLLDIGLKIDMDSYTLEIIKLLQDSLMSICVCEGKDEKYTYLKELCTNNIYKCIVASQHSGNEGEIWYSRILPCPFNFSDEHLVFTTPYIILDTSPNMWNKFIERNIFKIDSTDRVSSYQDFMKYGLSKTYWHEYIIKSHFRSNYTATYLQGMPKIQ